MAQKSNSPWQHQGTYMKISFFPPRVTRNKTTEQQHSQDYLGLYGCSVSVPDDSQRKSFWEPLFFCLPGELQHHKGKRHPWNRGKEFVHWPSLKATYRSFAISPNHMWVCSIQSEVRLTATTPSPGPKKPNEITFVRQINLTLSITGQRLFLMLVANALSHKYPTSDKRW